MTKPFRLARDPFRLVGLERAERGEDLEVVQKFSDEALTVCPACQGALRKVFSPVGIVFKGSGFYRTDSRKGTGSGSGDGAKKDKEPAGAKSSDSSSSDSGKSSANGSSSSAGSDSSSGSSGSSSSGSSSSGKSEKSSSSATPAASKAG